MFKGRQLSRNSFFVLANISHIKHTHESIYLRHVRLKIGNISFEEDIVVEIGYLAKHGTGRRTSN